MKRSRPKSALLRDPLLAISEIRQRAAQREHDSGFWRVEAIVGADYPVYVPLIQVPCSSCDGTIYLSEEYPDYLPLLCQGCAAYAKEEEVAHEPS